MFASKTPRDLNHDPKPYIDREDGPGKEIRQAWPDAWTEHDPRPEFDHTQHNEPNPILLAFRTNDDTRDPAEWLSYSESAYTGPTEHLHHARRVLTRLARLEVQ